MLACLIALVSPISSSQVVQVLRAIDRDEGGNDSTVYFNIPPESSAALNFSIRESGGVHCFSPCLILHLSRSSPLLLSLSLPILFQFPLFVFRTYAFSLYISAFLSIALSSSVSLLHLSSFHFSAPLCADTLFVFASPRHIYLLPVLRENLLWHSP